MEPQPTLDLTRSLATVTADAVVLAPESVRGFAGDPRRATRALADRLAVALASDSVGVARSMLEATVAYAAQRHQFGRPIGSFQAVKHACANALVQISTAAELLDEAVAALVDDGPRASVAASMAKAHATAIGVEVAGTAMQLHGGVGYAWESGIHTALKRAALNRALAGSPAAHRRWLAGRYRTSTGPTIGAL